MLLLRLKKKKRLLHLQESHPQGAKNGENFFPYAIHITYQGEESFLDALAAFPHYLIAQV